jgi:dimethylhistidine N-methyltransferase
MRHISLTAAPPLRDPQLASEIEYALSLTPRQIPSRYLYDDLGSALFEAICHLPWYGVTRSEAALLRDHAAAIVEAAGRPGRLVELGPGQGEKLATLIEHGWPSPPSLRLDLIDVSAVALTAAQQRLAQVGPMDIALWPLPYEQGLTEVALSEPAAGSTLALFLGSNIGNFDPPDAELLLRQLYAVLDEGDTLLIGTDLVKPEPLLQAAYDDPLGVTAAFNRNLLVRLNRELDADFDLSGYAHRAVWNPDASRMEMHLVSLSSQRVQVRGAGVTFTIGKGETIWTERSYKYRADEVRQWLADLGFTPVGQWQDGEAGFALTLARVD